MFRNLAHSRILSGMEGTTAKRNWFRLGIRSVLMLLAILFVGWLSIVIVNTWKQRDAVQAIRNIGGQRFNDVFSNVVFVKLSQTKVTDDGLKHLEGLHHLKYLYLMQVRITDAGLEHLTGLTALQHLGLGETQITDVGLKHLKGLVELQQLNLHGTKITDAGIECLKRLSRLQRLDIGYPSDGFRACISERTARTVVAESMWYSCHGCGLAAP